MASDLPVSDLTADLRGPAVERQRGKERRIKYRNVNMALLGQPKTLFWPDGTKPAPVWNDRNKFRMPQQDSRSCHCHGCRSWRAREQNKKKAVEKLHWDDEICTARQYPLSPSAEEREYLWDDSSSDSGSIEGVAYSFDRPGPSTGTDTLSYAVTEAVKKFENKELATLIKNEYEVIDASDSDEDFELV
ncbi:unnamed protein product [Tuber melanosporum]|jgi:hypothetical protein|uniref:(Perigord truffle) hypothetical protein n=1 Tax=Tuber melanosporum (strain Mel28) TaxID=656061 RepID=D5G6G5_TUBMM|nr:uncharacterized protein GSTUM_00004472001 [Tuber melanosporum]CAZ80108.1 unnamed protein product [Tuber melanosporum]